MDNDNDEQLDRIIQELSKLGESESNLPHILQLYEEAIVFDPENDFWRETFWDGERWLIEPLCALLNAHGMLDRIGILRTIRSKGLRKQIAEKYNLQSDT